MDLKILNRVLANLHEDEIGYNSYLNFQQEEVIKDYDTDSSYDGEYNQGDYKETRRIYKIMGVEDVYLAVNYFHDSYGDKRFKGVQFVKPEEKSIKTFVEL